MKKKILGGMVDSLYDDRCKPKRNGYFCDIWCSAYDEKF